MPPLQRGSVRKLASGRYQLRYYDETGFFPHYRHRVPRVMSR